MDASHARSTPGCAREGQTGGDVIVARATSNHCTDCSTVDLLDLCHQRDIKVIMLFDPYGQHNNYGPV